MPILILLWVSSAWSAETAGVTDPSVPAASSSSPADYGSGLNCLNRLKPPVADALSLTTRSGPVLPPERDAALFTARRDGKIGVYLVSPSAGSFDAVEPSRSDHGLNMLVKTPSPDGTMLAFRMYVDADGRTADGSNISTFKYLGAETQRKAVAIGAGTARLPPRDVHEALETEILARLRSVVAAVTKRIQYDRMTNDAYGFAQTERSVREMFTACCRTGYLRVRPVLEQITLKLEYKNLKICPAEVS